MCDACSTCAMYKVLQPSTVEHFCISARRIRHSGVPMNAALNIYNYTRASACTCTCACQVNDSNNIVSLLTFSLARVFALAKRHRQRERERERESYGLSFRWIFKILLDNLSLLREFDHDSDSNNSVSFLMLHSYPFSFCERERKPTLFRREK